LALTLTLTSFGCGEDEGSSASSPNPNFAGIGGVGSGNANQGLFVSQFGVEYAAPNMATFTMPQAGFPQGGTGGFPVNGGFPGVQNPGVASHGGVNPYRIRWSMAMQFLQPNGSAPGFYNLPYAERAPVQITVASERGQSYTFVGSVYVHPQGAPVGAKLSVTGAFFRAAGADMEFYPQIIVNADGTLDGVINLQDVNGTHMIAFDRGPGRK